MKNEKILRIGGRVAARREHEIFENGETAGYKQRFLLKTCRSPSRAAAQTCASLRKSRHLLVFIEK